jgi:hypothetical protein
MYCTPAVRVPTVQPCLFRLDVKGPGMVVRG